MKLTLFTTAAAIALTAGNALAAYNILQTATPAPTYAGHSITFDEPGVPVGVSINPFTFYQATDGISFGFGDATFMVVDDWDTMDGVAGGNGMGNQLKGGFNVRMKFDQDVTELSWQGWADGSPSFPFGGINVFLFNDDTQVATYSGVAPFGGIGNEWFNAVATDGDAFDEVRFFNGAFNSFFTYADNLSYNFVPEPSTFGLCGLAGLVGLAVRRRRRSAS